MFSVVSFMHSKKTKAKKHKEELECMHSLDIEKLRCEYVMICCYCHLRIKTVPCFPKTEANQKEEETTLVCCITSICIMEGHEKSPIIPLDIPSP